MEKYMKGGWLVVWFAVALVGLCLSSAWAMARKGHELRLLRMEQGVLMDGECGCL